MSTLLRGLSSESMNPNALSTPLTCPEQYCAGQVVTTMQPRQCDPSGVSVVRLEVFQSNDVNLIEMLGPRDPADAAAFVISVPHGGHQKPDFISDRSRTSSKYCPSSGCETKMDTNTMEIAYIIIAKFIQNFCKVPYVIINKLYRGKLDANRNLEEAAQGDPIAEQAWWSFHNYIQEAQNLVIEQMGTVQDLRGNEGARALLLDLHGYSGREWETPDGFPFIHWGYRLSPKTSLNTSDYCPLDDRTISNYSTAGSLTHASSLPGQSYECLVRGPGSLGSRVTGLPDMDMCGTGLPSYHYPNPGAMEEDPSICLDTPCNYYSGGYNIEVHEHLDWMNLSGTRFNTVMAELPQCIRLNSTALSPFADSLSIAVCSFLRDVFGEDDFSMAPTC